MATEPVLHVTVLSLFAIGAAATENVVFGWASLSALAGYSLSGSV